MSTKSASTFVQRRHSLAKQMHQRGGGLAIVATAPEVARNRDTEYPYRHDSYFYYLTGFTEPQSVLVMQVAADGSVHNTLFCRSKNEEREIWDGFRHGPDAARELYGFDEAQSIDTIHQRLPELLANQPALFYALGTDSSTDTQVQQWLAKVRAQARSGVSAPTTAFDIRHLVDEMRLRKDTSEIETMRKAASISAHAHCQAMRYCKPGMFEYEVEAHLLFEFKKGGSGFPAYGSIVAGGANACVLHYRENNAALKDGDLLLIDAGCELDGYASDITRTFPVNGRFSGPQKALYELVLASQQAAVEATKPGNRFIDPHDAAVKVLAQGMIDEGLLQGSLDGVLESETYKRFYMHRTGHWLGMDVHDCGDYRETVKGERPWRVLEQGMVLTIEPGIYVRAASDVDARFHNIGIRIEDDAVVTNSGCELISSGVPKTVAQIEALMAEA
jgi:Xaa-Pro aminopeptidase